ncbi:hypothetical protein ACSBR2_011152 [Camellia fascicularis]
MIIFYLVADNSDFIPKCPTANWELKDEIKCVLGKLFNSSRIDALLVQYWAPIITDGQTILTTQNQPFALSKIYEGLCWYRMISEEYKFYVDRETTEEELGLPGRVFKHELVESSPNVEYYSNKEYPQRKHALRCQIRAALALPVFEPIDHRCVGVLELVFTTRDAFLIFLEEACAYDAFLGLDLKCLNLWEHPFMEIQDKNEAALRDEILDVLKLVLEVHVLPLAQIWRTCWGIWAYHLRKGMGVVGTALKSLNLVFCADVTQFSITEYPMTHYAREFGLSGCGCFSVCLRSSNPGNDIYVLEFFLPTSNKVGGNVWTSLMKEILGTMKKKIKSFKLASGEELGEELIVEVIDFQYGEKKIRTLKLSSGEKPGEELFSEVTDFHNNEKLNSAQISQTRPEPLQNGADLMELESSDQQSMDAANNESNFINTEQNNSTCTQGKGTRKKLKRKQNKTGGKIEIFLEDILQTSQMRIGDAAKSLHVSISTLKRACRKLGIPRWPPHHINQINKSGGNSVQISPTTGFLPWLEPLQKEEQSNIAINCSQEKYAIKRSKRECKRTGIRIEIPLEDILQASEMSLNDAANSLNVSISTLKRACRKLGIPRWPPRHINKINKNGGDSFQISPTTGSLPRSAPLKNEGDMMQLDSLDQQSRDTTKNGGDVICSQEKGTMKMPYREDKKTGVRIAMPSENILQTSKESVEGAAEHHGVSQSAFKYASSPYVIKRWPTRMRRKITRSLPRTGPLQNGDDQMMQLDSSDEQSMDAINITNVVGAEQSNIAVTCSQEKDATKRSEREHKKTGVQIAIPIEDILQASEMSLNDAAYRLNINKSTLKCVCRGYGIEKWPPSKRTKFSCSQPLDEKQIQKLDSDLSSNQAWDIVTLIKPQDTATKDAEIVTIKAKYGNNIVIKFQLSSSLGLVELQQQVARRLNLDPETYHIRYKDEEDSRRLQLKF